MRRALQLGFAFGQSLLVAQLISTAPALAASNQSQAAATEAPPQPQQMIFFVAQGPADSCGPGCREWIAAEGRFDEEASPRFRTFIGTLGGRHLPVYFNSEGGIIGEARAIGRVLRQYRMTASIGRTVPDGCPSRDIAQPACRNIIGSGPTLKARLSSDAVCYSSCFYALVGATVRHVPPAAKLGIHGSRPTAASAAAATAGGPSREQLKAGRKKYLADMGVDPALADLSEEFAPETMHLLSRKEIARYGIESRGTPSIFHLAENQGAVAIVQVIRTPRHTEIHLQTQGPLRNICWESAGPNSPYLLAAGKRYRFQNGDRIADCPKRRDYAARETMVLRFDPLPPEVREFSLVEGQGGENQMMNPSSSSGTIYWNFVRVQSN